MEETKEVMKTWTITNNLLSAANALSELIDGSDMDRGCLKMDYKSALDLVNDVQMAAYAAAKKLKAIAIEEKEIVDMFHGQ